MNLTIFTDGGARGNPGHAGIGVMIFDQEGNILGEYKEYIGIATNNVAEYKALVFALQKALALNVNPLMAEIRMDSELVVRQMQGKYKIKEPALRLLAEEVVKLSKNFSKLDFKHIPREQNKLADKLVNLALDERLG